jgi:diguanylate cyclase (GGDEF)-like protein/PAS domain S-box-containing protein
VSAWTEEFPPEIPERGQLAVTRQPGVSPQPPERDLLDRLGAVVFKTDAEGNWTYVNRAWTEITGFSFEETIGTNFLEYVHPEEREHTLSLFMAVVEGGASECHHETRYRTRSGAYRWLELRASLLFGDHGELLGNCGTLVDITSRRLSESSIEERVQLTELVAGGESFDDLPFGAVLLDDDFVVQRASSTARKFLSHPLEPGTKFAELLPVFDVRDSRGTPLTPEWGPLATAARTRQRQYAELQWRPVRGDSSLSLQTTVIPSPRSGDHHGELVLLLQNVTELRQAETRLATVARLGQLALEAATLDGLLNEALQSVVRVLGVDFADLFVADGDDSLVLRANVGWQPALDSSDEVSGGLRHIAEVARLANRAVHTHQIRLPRVPEIGALYSVSVPGRSPAPRVILQAHSMRERSFTVDEVDFMVGVVSVLAASVERRRIEDAAVARSLHDPLTGLANRLLLHDRLDHAVRTGRRDNRGLAVLALDMNRFKVINDTFGHDAGDEVLCTVATRLVRATRDADTVARVGGDEFVLVLPGISSGDNAARMAEKLGSILHEEMRVSGESVRVLASIGVTVSPDANGTASDLLKQADVAMYEAKRADASYFVYGSSF